MGKRRKTKVRAQRKFAQGAYVPPPSTPLMATQVSTHSLVNATHKAVGAPGPVTKNVCSAKDLLTRMSLGKSHHHNIEPLIILEDCVKSLNIEGAKKKLAVKKKHDRRILHSTRNQTSDMGDRNSSVSDSGEDTPLSHLQILHVSASKKITHLTVGKTRGNISRTTKTDYDKTKGLVNPTSPIETKNKFGLHKEVKVIIERQGLKTRKNRTPSPDRKETPIRRSLKRHLKPENEPNEKRTKITSSPKKTVCTRKTLLPMQSSQSTTSLLQGEKSVRTEQNENHKGLDHADSASVNRNQLIEHMVHLDDDKDDDTMIQPLQILITNIESCNEEFKIKMESGQIEGADTSVMMIDPNMSSDDDMPPLKLEADTSDQSSSDILIAPSVSVELLSENSCNTSEVTEVNSPSNNIDMDPVQPEEIIDLSSCDSFRVPSMPARFTKSAETQCPLRSIVDLHTLLGSDVACNNCRRCTLIKKYETVLLNVPLSRGNDLLFLRRKPLPKFVYFKQQTSKKIKHQEVCEVISTKISPEWRQKVCEVLTTKTLPLWLINFQMKLRMHEIENEYNAGRLIQTLDLDPENNDDDLVEKIICRIDTLNSCIIQDNTELILEKSLPRLEIDQILLPLEVESDESVEEPDLVYRPTLEEFRDPITYINSIKKKASKYGMCKIIPPEGFQVPYHLDEKCVFGTTNQHLGRLCHRWGPNTREFSTIQTSLTVQTPEHKESFTKPPLFDGIEVDLVKLYHLILNEGGVQKIVSRDETWSRIAKEMFPCSKLDWKKLEKIYFKYVLPYDFLTSKERNDMAKKVDRIWDIRVKNAILRASQPLHYQHAMLSESNLPEYVEAFPDADIADLYNRCKPIFDKIEECIGKGRAMNLTKFRRISTQIEGMRFPNGLPSTVEEIERHYWDIMNKKDEHVCVLSAFIDTSVNSLGHESDPRKPGGSHPWNLKRIGENPSNILHSLGKVLSVTVPTLCLNQLFSTSCWHKDPHKLMWLDYMHEGDAKIWYAVPDSGAPAFQRAVQNLTEAAVQKKGIWLASDTTMIPPGALMASGVPFKRIEQKPNEYIVVFPGAYASSISTGFSVAESIYLETNTWLDHFEKVFEDMQKDCEPAMFSCVLLLMKMARNPTLSSQTLQRVCTFLKKFIKTEFEARREAQWLNCRVKTNTNGREAGNLMPVAWPNQEECCLCRVPLVLSKMSKYDQPRKQMCIAHGTQYMRMMNLRPEAERPEEMPLLTLHYTNQELIEMTGTLEIFTMVTD